MFIRILTILVVLGVVGFIALVAYARMQGAPANLGVTNGKLQDCPDSPNCISTQHNTKYPLADPIPYEGSLADAKSTMLAVLDGMDRNKVLSSTADYIHAEFRSPTIGFGDDVEFYFDDEAKVIHFRSASRMGYDDLKANPRRMKTIRAAFEAAN